jgi:hypothetical protein
VSVAAFRVGRLILIAVIARENGRSSNPSTSIETRAWGVLDAPLSRGMTPQMGMNVTVTILRQIRLRPWNLQPGGMSCRDAGWLKGKSHMRSALFVLLLLTTATLARDDGRYANSPLKPWFDSLKSGKGFCCSEADGRETEYDIRESRYWVPVNGVWTEVPDDAVITEPNKAGRPMLWLDPLQNIRCFIPGPGL